MIQPMTMKLSFMTFACPQWDFEQVLAGAVRHGFQGVEFRCDGGHAHGVEEQTPSETRAKMIEQLRAAGIEACCLATSLQMAQEGVLAEAGARLELARDIGAPAIRVFCGRPDEGQSLPQTIETAAANLRSTAQQAQQMGLEVWLETHDAACKGEVAAAILKLADHPAAGINYDIIHPYRMGEAVDTTLEHIGPYLRHAHFHDGMPDPKQVLIRPLGQGALPMDAMFQGLTKLGYTGYISGEWFRNQYGPTPDQSLAQFRSDMMRLAQHNGMVLEA